MKKLGSVEYLRLISSLVLAYNEEWRSLDEQKIELSEKDEKQRAKDWASLVAAAEEIKQTIGILPYHGKRKKEEEPCGPSSDSSAEPD
jgi:hypothetical protein